MKKLAMLFGVIGLVFGGVVAFAGELTGVGGNYWSRLLAVTTTSGCVKASSHASAKCALFPAGSSAGNWKNRNVAVVGATADTILCWALAPGVDIDTTLMEIGTTDRGNCFTAPTLPLLLSQKPVWSNLQAAAGSATGICSIPIGGTAVDAWDNGGAGDTLMYAPCAADADCATNHGSSLSAATCTAFASTTAVQQANVGAYLIAETPSGTSTLRVFKDRVLSY